MTYDFDLFVIGGGSGGIATARRAASYGAKVAVAESDRLGGTCVNRGCVPKKLMVYASRFPKYVEDSAGYGWDVAPGNFDWRQMITDVTNEVKRLNGIYQRMVDNADVKVFPGHAKLLDGHTIEVGEEKVTAERILVAVGGKPVKPDIPGLEYAITSDDMFEMTEQPKKMVILGGGYIGCEFACVMNRLGTEVTVVIRKEQILSGFDQDLRNELHEAMVKQGIRIVINAQVVSVESKGDGVNVMINDGKDNEVIIADAVHLAATGRKPKLENLGLESTAVEVSEKGAIATDKHGQTAEPSIYAIGDCTDRINLTPVAINEGRVLADTLYGNKPRLMSYEAIPSAVFTTPEAASVGITEETAVENYGEDNIRVFRSRFRSMYYTLPNKDEKTLMKLIVRTEDDRILGAHMVGDHAAEIIQGVAIALKMGATKADFDATVGIHPSSAEEFVTMS
ncbi:MAG: glutathione-disulfide reductase [Cyanobacteria bacterium J06649_5]